MARDVVARSYPEVGAGGFTRLDGTLEFYSRVNALLRPSMRVLDVGAGRAGWLDTAQPGFRKDLRILRGKVAEVVAQDIDPVVHQNPTADCTVHTAPGNWMPFQKGSFDLVVADFVLEHVSQPEQFAADIRWVLKPGGWFCARTPNRRSYVALATRIVRNSHHARLLRLAQPDRKEVDVFPTAFALNTRRDIAKHFPADAFEDFTYFYQPEPAYHFNSPLLLGAMRLADKLLPESLSSNLFVFLRRR